MIQAQACGQCGRFSLPKNDTLAAHGFGCCKLLPEWNRVPEAVPCRFSPSLFQERAA